MVNEQLDSMSAEQIEAYLKARRQKPYEDALEALKKSAEEVGKQHGNKTARRVLTDCAERCPKAR